MKTWKRINKSDHRAHKRRLAREAEGLKKIAAKGEAAILNYYTNLAMDRVFFSLFPPFLMKRRKVLTLDR